MKVPSTIVLQGLYDYGIRFLNGNTSPIIVYGL